MKTSSQSYQPNFSIRMLLGALFYPIAFCTLVSPTTGERSEEVIKSFLVALFSSLSCVALIPVIFRCSRPQKLTAICFLLIPVCAGFYALNDLGYYFLIELKYHHRNWLLLKWLKLP